ncbi:DUF3658 domain-containing protein [Lactiplantibacillus paraplantarum]|uniref:DUF3658 domain-containing protein n=1 Tax=Lactiplantibacillus paraplantarum TaxID=60520 RepID=UPI0023AA61E2|nr:DUF3658 domain-containing protein [Lactiplantibacillus paraplantarum]WEE36086.1 DUF3658 domain-containing protein [Lactiplantibacillus paraplantarum]
MMDVTFNSTFAATLQYELHQPVLSLPLSLQIGDLTRLTTDGPAQLANSADDPVVKQALATLKSQVKPGAVLRVWWSTMPDDWVGFDWLCQQLVDTDAQLRQVMVPLSQVITQPGLALQSLAELSEILPEDIAHYLQLAQVVSKNEQRAHSYEWQALVAENAPLRVNLNGHLVSVAADFYDSLLERQIQPGRPVVQIIGEMLMRYSLGLPDWWYRARIQHILSTRG